MKRLPAIVVNNRSWIRVATCHGACRQIVLVSRIGIMPIMEVANDVTGPEGA
mgnify:CR=1 FL=1